MAGKRVSQDKIAAFSFINTNDVPTESQDRKIIPAGAEIPEGYKLVTEKRTRRVGFVMSPTAYKRMEDHCKAAGVSVSEFINSAVEEKLSRA